MDRQLQRLMDLSKRTGDRLIVFDPSDKEKTFVVMDIDEYENLSMGLSDVKGLTEGELLDKINRDIDDWKNEKNKDEEVFLKVKEEDGLRFYSDEDLTEEEDIDEVSDDEIDDWYSINDIAKQGELRDNDKKKEPERKKGAWKIPSDRQENAEEIIEEDRYYLESLED